MSIKQQNDLDTILRHYGCSSRLVSEKFPSAVRSLQKVCSHDVRDPAVISRSRSFDDNAVVILQFQTSVPANLLSLCCFKNNLKVLRYENF